MFKTSSNYIDSMLSPTTTIFSISMLVLCSTRLPESSDFEDRNIKIVLPLLLQLLYSDCEHAVISKDVNKIRRR